jgi:hypothetical protein
MWGNTVTIHNVFFFKKKSTKLNYQLAQYEKKLKLTDNSEKKNLMGKHCNNQQCFKEKTIKLNSQPVQY